jgi:Common central domain of tyrosinase
LRPLGIKSWSFHFPNKKAIYMKSFVPIVILCFWIWSCNNTAPQIFIRQNANLPAASADLQALAAAMKMMKAMPCNTVCSWYYQGAIHSVPMSLPNGNPYCSSYLGGMQDLKTAWMNCTHDSQHPELHFLIWHRLFIWYFEKIIRKLSGKVDFALPYWDYTDANYRTMPPPFTDSSSSLFEPARSTGLNQGNTIDAGMDATLDMTNNDNDRLYSLFNTDLDDGLHGAMHEYIGGAYDGLSTFNEIYQQNNMPGLMAEVPSAAFDPIFWIHHANIDYLWTRWDESSNGARPIISDLQASPTAYVFFDENGQQVNFTVQQAYDTIFHLDYVYSGLVHLVRPVLPFQNPEKKETFTVFKPKIPILIPIAKDTILINLPIPKSAESVRRFNRDSNVLILNLSVSFLKEPKGIYEVYLNTDSATRKNLIGVMSFFGAAHMQPEGKEIVKTFQFDISNKLDIKAFTGGLKFLFVKKGAGKDSIQLSQVALEKRNIR